MQSPSHHAGVIVVGSANQDYIVRVARPPRQGETVLASDLLNQPGGKGANQAVAAARLQGSVSLIACLGDDADGALLLRQLRSEGVDTTYVEIMGRGRTGIALVSVSDTGENSIMVVPGANSALDPHRVARAIGRLAADAQVMVIQAELTRPVIEEAIRSAQSHGLRAILNLAPFQPLDRDVIALCDPLVVNESEASDLVGSVVCDEQSALAARTHLLGMARSVVITLGAAGAYWADQHTSGHAPAPEVARVVDTTGAGDAFVGALATVLAQGGTLEQAVGLGVRAGTYSITSRGAQSSYPHLSDVGTGQSAD